MSVNDLQRKDGVKGVENRVLRRLFKPNMEKVRGGWRNLHSEELYNL
jgi:hypothetical protein